MTREEAMRQHPSYYWHEIYAPRDAEDAATAARAIAPVVDLFTREVIK
jgi:hypothetical protein